jgi:hypothetical protein
VVSVPSYDAPRRDPLARRLSGMRESPQGGGRVLVDWVRVTAPGK